MKIYSSNFSDLAKGIISILLGIAMIIAAFNWVV